MQQKTSSPPVEANTDYDIDTSPPYSPTPSEMERPSIHPQIIFDLRQVCAIIVNETNPPDPDEEPDHRETLRKFEEERQAKRAAQAAQARAAEVKLREAEAKSEKAAARSQQRVNEKAQKEHARKVEAEARRAIAREAEPERRKVIERQAELRMGTSADNLKDQTRKEPPRRYSTRRPPEDVPSFATKSEPRVAIPKGAPAFEASRDHRKPSETYNVTMEPLEPTHTKVSSKAKGKQKEVIYPEQRQLSETRSATKLELLPPVHATIVQNTRSRQRDADEPVLDHIRASLHERPKTSAAATVDYEDPSGGSSKSTTRSNTEYDSRGRPTSTAVTSAVLTPGEDNRISYNRKPSVDSFRQRPSDDSYRDGELSAQARAWQEQKEAIRRAEEKYNKSGRAARPGSKASKRSRRWGGDGDSEYERPMSRAGSISESIRSGFSYYMRSRGSQDNLRSGRSSAAGLSRSESRSSSVSRRSSSGWWRGAGLRRKGSWSSFRSSRLDNDEPSKLRKNGEPNLNRPLPALPGLDQYKETKTHIGQLMKAGARGRKKEKTPKTDRQNAFQHQQSQGQQANRHVKKDSISNPILRNSSMDRTLHRYRESQIMQEPSRSQSRQHQHRDSHHPPDLRKNSSNSLPRSHSRTSHRASSSIPLKSPSLKKTRRDSDLSTANSHNAKPPPMIRGPSWQKEIEAAVYPRPMDVNKGDAVEVTRSGAGGEGLSPQREMGEWERKGGLKGRVGRIFGGREARVVHTSGRTVAAR